MTYSEEQLALWQKQLSLSLNPKRFAHSLAVRDLAVRLAQIWHLDENKAEVAGLLHDIARSLSLDELLTLAEEAHWPVGEEEKSNPLLLHAPLGAYLLRKQGTIDDKEILQAIAFHTLANPQMTDFDKIIFLADACEEGRNWQGVEEVRKYLQIDLDYAMFLYLEHLLAWLSAEGKPIHSSAYEAYDFFRQKASKNNII